MNKHRTGRALLATTIMVLACGPLEACSSSDTGGSGASGGSSLYTATCDDACNKQVTCGKIQSSELQSCTNDCITEPWPNNYRQCRASTCGLTDKECESYGLKTCEEACSKLVSCGTKASGEYDKCVADCKTEPWPGNAIDCYATLCGATEAQCEKFTG